MSTVWVAVVAGMATVLGALVSQAFSWLAAKRAAQSADAKVHVEDDAKVRDLLWQQVSALEGKVAKLEEKVAALQRELDEKKAELIERDRVNAEQTMQLTELAMVARNCPRPREECPVRSSGLLPRINPTGRLRAVTVPCAVPEAEEDDPKK